MNQQLKQRKGDESDAAGQHTKSVPAHTTGCRESTVANSSAHHRVLHFIRKKATSDTGDRLITQQS
jgi:hypothetical protein